MSDKLGRATLEADAAKLRALIATAPPVSGYVPATRQVIAGDGLTGGGALTADVTLNAGAGNGIEVSADSIAVKLSSPANPGMFFDAGGLRIGAGVGITVDPASVKIDQAFSPTWTGLHTFDRTGAPFALGANAQGQLVTGLNADLLDGLHGSDLVPVTRQVNAGDGLTGGGALNANITLNVGAGDGITVNPDSVALTTPGTLSESSVNNAAGNHTHAVSASANPGAAASLLKTDSAGALQLVNLTLSGYLNTSRVNSGLIPLTTDTFDLGSSTLLWRKGWLSELDAVLFAINTATLLGGWFIVGPDAGTLAADVGASDTDVDFGKAMTNGHFVLFRAAGQVEYMQVGTLVSGTRYNVTRNLDGSGANAWAAGTPFSVNGTTGMGRIEANAYDTPRIQILLQGATYDAQTETMRFGDLNGNWGYSVERYGVAIGQYAAGMPNMTYDTTSGLRLRVYDTTYIHFDVTGSAFINGKLKMEGTASAIAIGTTPPTSASAGTGLWLDRTGLYGLNSNTQQAIFSAADGKITAGAGKLTLDASGLTMSQEAAAEARVKWANAGTVYSYIESGLISVPNPRYFEFYTKARATEKAGMHFQVVDNAGNSDLNFYLEEGYAYFDKGVGFPGGAWIGGTGADANTIKTSGVLFWSEITANPDTSEVISGGAMAIYMKADKIVIAYNHGGTMKYRYLDLTSAAATWVYTTTAP